MKYRNRYTDEANDDLKRLYAILLELDIQSAECALQSIANAMDLLKTFPFTCRKTRFENPFLRELIIPFGNNGYVALFEIEENSMVTIFALRHQREDDYR